MSRLYSHCRVFSDRSLTELKAPDTIVDFFSDMKLQAALAIAERLRSDGVEANPEEIGRNASITIRLEAFYTHEEDRS